MHVLGAVAERLAVDRMVDVGVVFFVERGGSGRRPVARRLNTVVEQITVNRVLLRLPRNAEVGERQVGVLLRALAGESDAVGSVVIVPQRGVELAGRRRVALVERR